MSTVALCRGLLDTPLVMAIETGEPDAILFCQDLLKTSGLDISELSAITLLAAAQDHAEHATRLLFVTHIRVHRLTARIARRARGYVSSLPVPMPITADDAIIAATAIEHSLPLYTLDPARFANLTGVAALQAY
jgi:predicted nucleic acid-binding protein